MSSIIKKVTGAGDLQKMTPRPVGGSAMDAVTNIGSLTEDQVKTYLASLSNEDRAKLMIGAILATKTGRRY